MKSSTTLKILVVAPHHDDEVIGCGGSIAYLSGLGHHVDVAYMTAGDVGIPGIEKARAIDIREDEARRAGQKLGIQELFFLRYADRDLVYSLAAVKRVLTLLRKGCYTSVLFPHANEQDYEHRVTHAIVGQATWMAASPYFPELGNSIQQFEHILLYEVWTPLTTYHMKVDISNHLNLKLDALSQYRTQFTNDQAQRILGLNTYRAAMHSEDMKAIEVFQFYTHDQTTHLYPAL